MSTEAQQIANQIETETQQEGNTKVRVATGFKALNRDKAEIDASNIDDNVDDWKSKLGISEKADLVGGKVPASQLPSYVDDVIECANLAAFPNPGETGKIYVALDTNKQYRWSGSAYIDLTQGSPDDLSRLSQIRKVTYSQDANNYYVKGEVFWILKDNTLTNFAPGILAFYLNGTLQNGTGISIDRDVPPVFVTIQMRDINGLSVSAGTAMIPFTITIPKSTNTSGFYTNGFGVITVVLTYSSFTPSNKNVSTIYTLRAV